MTAPFRAGTRAVLALCLFFLIVLITALTLDRLYPFPVERLEPPPSVRVLDRNGRPLRYFLASDGMWRFPVTLDQVAPDLVAAIIDSEDRHYRIHPGVNPLAMARALWINLRSGRIVSGASTIPMQVARMADPSPRTVRAKFIETLRALQLSAHYSKDQILTWYLNLAPFGGNIVGVGAASWHYFDKDPSRLSLGEIALLSVLPRSPTRYNPLRHPDRAIQVRDRVLRRFLAQRTFDPRHISDALSRPLLAAKQDIPRAAPHFSQWVQGRADSTGLLPTSLDSSMQAMAERLVAARMDSLRRAAIANAAVVVLDLRTREILVHIGSADFWDDTAQGQVDNTLSRRSPGSTLKPLLYALAFDQGHLTPETMLLDVPTDFAGYRPENYGQNFQGLVSARLALAQSLNVPAVRLLARCGQPAFLDLLRRGGLTTLDQPPGHYGLAVALGGCETRLLELTNLYATLGSGGVHRPVSATPHQTFPTGQEERLFSPEAAQMVVSVLSAVRRPELADAWQFTVNAPAVAWKTGTSFGHRDAWAIGLSRDLAIGVWVGNPDGSQCKDISGLRHAGPLLFDLFRALRPGGTGLPRINAPRLTYVSVCAVSGERPGPLCPRTRTQAIAGVTRLAPCSMHQQIFVHEDSGLRLHGDCLLGHPSREQAAVIWPPELLAWQRAQGRDPGGLPPLHPGCLDVPAETGPVILSPSALTPYVLRPDAPSRFQQLSLLAAPGTGASTHYWYVNSVFVGQSDPSTPRFVQPGPGRHRVSVTDNLGRSATGLFTVLDPVAAESLPPDLPGLGSRDRP